jgi:ABC-type multidrug transport system fused ATPase/permease subunit
LSQAEANFVFDLDKWLDTVIWERWLKLSGWEKQRLSIARLFLKNPEILILDEATSALDNKTEKVIQKALDKLMKGRTSIIVAHRLTTIMDVDNILYIEHGEILESWNYKELMNKEWKFAELASSNHLMIN